MKSKQGSRQRGIGLGIDAGGTYTDSVLYDFSRRQVLAASKARTTHHDYAVGIRDSLDSLLRRYDGNAAARIGRVSLSTTFATNAIVEGRGGRTGLILIGYSAHAVRKIVGEPKIGIRGRHSIDGDVIEPLNEREARRAIRKLLAKGAEAMAISSEVGVRNPAFELRVRDLASRIRKMPVVCGSQITDEINCVKRANACFANARLIPLVSDLFSSVKRVLSGNGIHAPLMIVRGDGALMGEEVAQELPLEMVLSGPAASIIGGIHLTGVTDGWIMDMGGTTTDVAYVKNGSVSLRDTGVVIDGLRIAGRAMDVHAFGLGGDSYIQCDGKTGTIRVGPERVVPICYLASTSPRIRSQLEETDEAVNGDEILVQPADFFVFQKGEHDGQLHPQEEAILQALRAKSPMSRKELAERVGAVSVALIRTERLEDGGNIVRSALTPTDLFHASGKIALWNRQAAQKSVSLYARRAGLDEGAFMEEAFKVFYGVLLSHLFVFWLSEDKGRIGNPKFSSVLASHILRPGEDIHLSAQLRKAVAIVGAPARTHLPWFRKIMHVDSTVPEYADVANAVGAVIGAVREEVKILIRPKGEHGYVAYASGEKRCYASLEEAKQEALQLAEEMALGKARRSGAVNPAVRGNIEDVVAEDSLGGEVYVETVVTASAWSASVGERIRG